MRWLMWSFAYAVLLGSQAVEVSHLEPSSDGTMRREVRPPAKPDLYATRTLYPTAPPTWDESLRRTLKDRVNTSDPWFNAVIGHLQNDAQAQQNRQTEEELAWKQQLADEIAAAKKDGKKYIPENGYTFGYGPPGPTAYGPDDKPGASGFQGPRGRLNAGLDAHSDMIKNTTRAAAKLKKMLQKFVGPDGHVEPIQSES
mmetsp:Transcript_18034/g.41810  ORF Transcript_18034/g.41810 Transcript_18034/m.41810 type:complete len:199 (+) Transcript_18034:86-682(+)